VPATQENTKAENTLTSIKKNLANKSLITDLITVLVITFGVVLIYTGIILITANPPQGNSQGGLTSQFAISVVNSIPGVPFAMADLSQYSLAAIGLVSWIIGLNLMVIGLGLWVKHRFARTVALIVFGLATVFQFFQFLLLGVMGSPIAIIQIGINCTITFMLFLKYDFLAPSQTSNMNV
jgi:hypothetical protein